MSSQDGKGMDVTRNILACPISVYVADDAGLLVDDVDHSEAIGTASLTQIWVSRHLCDIQPRSSADSGTRGARELHLSGTPPQTATRGVRAEVLKFRRGGYKVKS